jgi:multidrug efflux pump subunit AcrB
MSKFFINRPIVAMVIAILMVIVGAVTIATLPIAQFPNIAPPEIRLQANYPGADAKTLEDAVATPIEQQVNGVDNMTYMYSLNATANQQTSLIVDFDLKTDPNTDLLLTQSREQLATGQLPPSVNSYGVALKKSTTAPLMLIALYSPHGTHDATYLANYAYINLNDPVARLYGVGQTQVFGAGQYAMRLWVKPDQLAKLGITVTDISDAIQAQNTVNPAGQVGGEPAPPDQQYTYAVLAQGRLKSPEEFGNVIVREAPNGGIVRVKDVARVELGTQDYSTLCRLNGKAAAGLAVYQLPGTNGVQTVEGVRKLMAQMKQRFPNDLDYAISLDQTAFGHRRHEGDYLDTSDCDCAGDPGGLSLSPGLARHADSTVGCACLSGWNVCPLSAVRLLDQHAFDVRAGTRHRPGGRRRDRRCRRCAAPHRRRPKAQGRGSKSDVALSDVYNTIQANMGGLFVNYYNEFGRTWQVYIESEAPYRSNTNNLGQFYVRNNQGEAVPLSALASFETRSGPEFIMRYNEYRSAQINASAAPGYSSDQARTALEDVFRQTMPHEMGFDYMGMSYQEQKAEEGVPSSVIFGFSLLFVLLILAALYEAGVCRSVYC